MRVANKPTYSFIILTIVFIIINTLVARYIAYSPPYDSPIPALYPAVVFMILFTLWFGAYGAIAAYAGCFLGAGILSGTIPPGVAVYWSLADLWQVLIPLAALRMLDIDPGMRTRTDMLMVILFAVLINNAFGAAWGSVTLAFGNVIAWAQVPPVFASWFFGNVILTALLLLPALFYLTPKIERSKLFVRQYWN